MKFSNGCWLQRERTECFSSAELYESKRSKSSISFTAPTHKINHRGDTLGGPNLTIEITSPMEDVIRVTTYHYKGAKDSGTEFELNISDTELDIKENNSHYIITTGTLSLYMNKHNGDMEYKRNNKKLTASKWRDLAYIKTDYKGLAYETNNDDAYMREQLSMSVGELIYGLGERFTPFIKNGQTVDIWNEDGGTSTELSYKNIPFYISNKGYGVFVNSSDKVSYEIGSELVKKVCFSVPGEKLDYFIINGPSMKEVLKKYTDITGKPALVSPWTFGLWLSTSFTTNYDEETVNTFVDGMAERSIPLSVFHFDCFWMKGFCWTDFTWDEKIFPDPKGMLERLKAKGLKICVWINPYIAQESSLFDEGMDKGYFVMRKNGDVWQWDMWQPGMALVDFTNPEACSWYASKLEELMDMGVDCFKTDFGERIPTQDIQYYNNAHPVKMHNYYTLLYNKVVFELLERKRGKKEAVLFARSATVGGQKYPVHWGGDCWSDYESMSESLRGGLSLTMSGFGFWSHDIGGFEDKSTPDVYKRWVAFGLMSSHSRLHGSSSYRVPWNYDEESVEVVRFFTQLKNSLMPYIYRNAIETHITGIPTMRSMILEFENDLTCGYLDKQYMFGDSILVAPILNEEGMGEFYLPEGIWTNYFTGQNIIGPKWVREYHDYYSIPCYIREHTILAVGSVNNRADYDYTDNVVFKLYNLVDGKEASTVVYDGDANIQVHFYAKKEANNISFRYEAKNGRKAYEIYIEGMRETYGIESLDEIKVSHGAATLTEKGFIITPKMDMDIGREIILTILK